MNFGGGVNQEFNIEFRPIIHGTVQTFEPEVGLEVQEPIIDTESELSTSWYKEAVFYEVYVRAFFDSNCDGIGDIPGLTSKLDYLYGLGINCIWLLPIYPSPLKDDGYDVSDYYNVHPDYGTLDDFKVLVRSVHERNMRIIMDFIPNHTSDQHDWFKKSREKKEDNPYRDWYVWSKDPNKYHNARIIFLDTEKSNWALDEKTGEYYWHRFYTSQPDLNFENPAVQEEMKNVMRFWLDIGIDGFRVDAVPYLFEQEETSSENLPQTHAYLKQLRSMIETEYPGRVMLAEACQLPEDVRDYFGDGDEFHMGFHFPVMPRIFGSLMAEDATFLKKILAETPEIPSNCQWVIFLRNHDELTLEMVTKEERQFMWEKYAPEPRMRINLGIRRRLAPLLNNDRRKIELVHSILFTLPGSPILYYGDEICMGDNIWLPDRNGVRTPMQWDATDPHGGFSKSLLSFTPAISSGEYGYKRVNVMDSLKDPSSFYNILRHMVWLRRKHPSLGRGKLQWIDAHVDLHDGYPPSTDHGVAAWVRYFGIDKVLVVHNLTHEKKKVTLEIPLKFLHFNQGFCQDIFTASQLRIGKSFKGGLVEVSLAPFQSQWLNLTSPTLLSERCSLSLVW